MLHLLIYGVKLLLRQHFILKMLSLLQLALTDDLYIFLSTIIKHIYRQASRSCFSRHIEGSTDFFLSFSYHITEASISVAYNCYASTSSPSQLQSFPWHSPMLPHQMMKHWRTHCYPGLLKIVAMVLKEIISPTQTHIL